jgi:hypothetical protein
VKKIRNTAIALLAPFLGASGEPAAQTVVDNDPACESTEEAVAAAEAEGLPMTKLEELSPDEVKRFTLQISHVEVDRVTFWLAPRVNKVVIFYATDGCVNGYDAVEPFVAAKALAELRENSSSRAQPGNGVLPIPI